MSEPCVSGPACVDYDRATRQPAYADRGPLCAGCLTVAGRDIANLRDDYTDLCGALSPRYTSGVDSAWVSGTVEATSPIALDVDALASGIVFALTVWEPPVREFARLPPERAVGVRPGWAVITAVDVIAPRVDVLAGLPPVAGYADGWDAGPVVRDGLDAVAQLRALHKAARRQLGLTRRTVRLPGECSGCGTMRLIRLVGARGSDTVECARCGRRWSYDDYLRYAQLILGGVG